MNILEPDYSVNVTQSILWQYNQAEKLINLVQDKQNWLDINQSQFWQDWQVNVFNLYTANSFGLSVWSIILNIPFFVRDDLPDEPVFGFNEVPEINPWVNYNRGYFADYSQSQYILTVEEQRIILKLRYYQLISRGSLTDTNQFLDLIFNDPDGLYQGGAWMIDNLDMTITYVFNTTPQISPELLGVIEDYDLLPRPASVGISYTII